MPPQFELEADYVVEVRFVGRTDLDVRQRSHVRF